MSFTARLAVNVSVSASEATSLYILPPVFALYKKQYTRVNLNIVRSEHSRSLEAVFNRDVDFAIVSLPHQGSRLVVHPIHRDDIVLVVAPTHPLAMREVVKLDEMMQFPMLLLKQRPPAHTAQQLLSPPRTATAHRHGTGLQRVAQAADLRRTGHGVSAACQRS